MEDLLGKDKGSEDQFDYEKENKKLDDYLKTIQSNIKYLMNSIHLFLWLIFIL